MVRRLKEIDPEKVIQDLKLVYLWGDIPVLTDIFKKIDRLFKWSEHMPSYKCVRERLFQSWPSDVEYGSELKFNGPIVYKHQSDFVKTRASVLKSQMVEHSEWYKGVCERLDNMLLRNEERGVDEVDYLCDGIEKLTLLDDTLDELNIDIDAGVEPEVMPQAVHVTMQEDDTTEPAKDELLAVYATDNKHASQVKGVVTHDWTVMDTPTPDYAR